MMPIPIAQYLGRLSGTSAAAGADLATVETACVRAAAAEAHRQAHVERDREAAYLHGMRDGEAKVAAAFEQTLADERSSADARLAEERGRWAIDSGARLARSLRENFEALEHRLADQVGRVLEPFLETQIQVRALRELRDALSILLTGAEHPAVQVCGPADLLAAMRDGAADSLDGVAFVENEAVDIRIVAADTTIESQLHAWAARLREAMI